MTKVMTSCIVFLYQGLPLDQVSNSYKEVKIPGGGGVYHPPSTNHVCKKGSTHEELKYHKRNLENLF